MRRYEHENLHLTMSSEPGSPGFMARDRLALGVRPTTAQPAGVPEPDTNRACGRAGAPRDRGPRMA